MIANSAFLAAMVLMLITFFVAGELSFLAPYKHLILGGYAAVIVSALAVVFINLFAVFYLLTRSLFLKDTGRNFEGNIPLAVRRLDTRCPKPDIVHADLKVRAFRGNNDRVLITDIQRYGCIHLLWRQIDTPLPPVHLARKAELFIGKDIAAAAIG